MRSLTINPILGFGFSSASSKSLMAWSVGLSLRSQIVILKILVPPG
jgi:hypothetical protein